ncbi:MAG: hypothetical protein Kow0027_28320 [Saprospiraceae bacterium]
MNYECKIDSLTLSFQVCNQDSFPLPVGTPVTIYDNNPTLTNAGILSQTNLGLSVLPGECKTFQATIPSTGTTQTIYIVANDDGSLTPPFDLDNDFPSTDILECDYSNNIGILTIDYSPPALNLDDQVVTCDFQSATFDAGPGFAEYVWQDGSSEQTYTAWQPGTYWVTVKDSCGGIQSDTVQFIFNPSTVLDIGFDTIEICLGDTAQVALSGFSGYQWSPSEGLSCDTCATVTISPDSSTCYYIVGNNSDGCYSIDTLCVEIKTDTAETTQNALLCPGDSINFFGQWVHAPGVYEFTQPIGNCFLLTRLIVTTAPAPIIDFSYSTPCPDQANGTITASASGGIAPYIYEWQGATGPTITNIPAGNYPVTVTDSNGCATTDSLSLLPAIEPQLDFSVAAPTCVEYTDGTLEINNPDPDLLFGLSPQNLGSNYLFDGLPSGFHTLYFKDMLGCLWDTSFLIPEALPFSVNLPTDSIIYCGDSITLQPVASMPVVGYNWSPSEGLSCNTCPSPTVTLSQSTTYTLTAISEQGCTATDSISVKISDDARIYIPNAFTPNGDGINDVFYIFGDNIDKVLVFRVFDRWGGMVHEKTNFPPNDPAFGWDGRHRGKPANIEVYAWYARLQLCNGTIVFKKGDVTLLR